MFNTFRSNPFLVSLFLSVLMILLLRAEESFTKKEKTKGAYVKQFMLTFVLLFTSTQLYTVHSVKNMKIFTGNPDF